MRSPRSVFVGVAVTAALLIYLCYSNLSSSQALRALELKVERLHRTREQMTAQLQVVTEHRQRLEQSLEDYKSKLQAVKEEAEKQRNNLKTTLDEANQRLHREALQRRQAEEAMEAARLEHEHAYEELQKAKDDEVQRLAESLGAQRRWCKQLQEKFDEYSKLKVFEARPLQGAARASVAAGKESIPAESSDGGQVNSNWAVPNLADDRQDVVQKGLADADAPPMAGAEVVHAAGGGGRLQLPQAQQQAGLARRAAAQARVQREAADVGRQMAQVPAARDEAQSDAHQRRDSALGGINKPDLTQGQGAGAHVRPDFQASAQPDLIGQPRQIAAQGDGFAKAGRAFIGEDYKGHHRQRVHDADEAAVDPRERQANDGDLIHDQLENDDEKDVDARGHTVLQIDHRPGFDPDFGKES